MYYSLYMKSAALGASFYGSLSISSHVPSASNDPRGSHVHATRLLGLSVSCRALTNAARVRTYVL